MPEHPDHEMIDWVIGKPQGEEAKTLRAAWTVQPMPPYPS